MVFDYQVKRRRQCKYKYYCQPEIKSVEGLLDLIFTDGNGKPLDKRDSAFECPGVLSPDSALIQESLSNAGVLVANACAIELDRAIKLTSDLVAVH